MPSQKGMVNGSRSIETMNEVDNKIEISRLINYRRRFIVSGEMIHDNNRSNAIDHVTHFHMAP